MAETSVRTFQGRVKWFNPKAGYGFITLLDSGDGLEDVFVHHSGLKPKQECFKTLYQGEYVELGILTDEHGKKFGTNVTGILGHELMCERFANSEESAQRMDVGGGEWNTVENKRDNDRQTRGKGRMERGDRRGGRFERRSPREE